MNNNYLKKIEKLPIIPQKVHINETSSFSFGILLPDKYQREYLLEYLPKKGIECRPIVAGNLLKQPIFSKMNLKKHFFKNNHYTLRAKGIIRNS